MLNFNRIIAIVLLISPLTFWGQARNSHQIKTNSGPISNSKMSSKDKSPSRNYIYVLAGVGTTLLDGDNSLGYKPGFEGNIGIGYQIHEWVGIEGKLGYATFGGKYNGVKSQFSNAFEANVNLMVNLTNIIFGYQSNRKYDIIPHIGWGQVESRGRVVYEDGRKTSYGYENIQEHNTTLVNNLVDNRFEPNGDGLGGRVVARMQSAGILFNYILNNKIKLGLDLVSTRVDTDRFDAVPAGFHYDWYTTFNVRVQYRLQLRQKVDSPCDNLFGDYKRR